MNRLRSTVLLACLTLLPASAMAQGATLHGFGPINSSMGGAGVALPEDSLNALGFNPALLAAAEGNQLSFATEFFKDGIQIHTTLGTLSGDAHPSNQLNIVPAFGWMLRDPNKKLALGFGLIGVAGFSTDYPQDNASMLFAQPPNGFGRVFTDYSVTKIPVALRLPGDAETLGRRLAERVRGPVLRQAAAVPTSSTSARTAIGGIRKREKRASGSLWPGSSASSTRRVRS